MYCTKCGMQVPDGMNFCPVCGAEVKATDAQNASEGAQKPQVDMQYQETQNAGNTGYQQAYNNGQQQTNGYYSNAAYNPADEEANLPEKYRPISVLGYIGYQILFAIPVIGFIFVLIFAFKGDTNKNLQNFARAELVFIIIVVILTILFCIIAGAAVLALYQSGGSPYDDPSIYMQNSL